MPDPIAVATANRRFYRALDTLTTSSQSSLTTSISKTVTTTSKRPATAAAAFDEARERAAKRLRQSTSSSSLPHTVIPPPKASKSDETKSRDPPHFSPWSPEAFLKRLKTFSSVSLWHPKPEAISEVEWAKRGWVCVDVNTVGCRGGCEKRVVVSLAKPRKANVEEEEDHESEDGEDEQAFEQALVDRYKDEIVNGHAINCPWRKDGCKDEIYRLQVVRPAVWQPELRRRYQSLLEIRSAIHNIKTKPAESDDSKTLTSAKLLEDLSQHLLKDLDSDGCAMEIALHGWRGSIESGNQLLNCDACFQRIGLWMYQPDYRPARSGSDDENDEAAAIVDLVEMHRDHCPWRSPASQKASGSLTGLNALEILQRVASTYSRDQRRRSNEQTAEENGHAEPCAADSEEKDAPVLPRDEVARQDKERESRIRKLKSLFSIRRKAKTEKKA